MADEIFLEGTGTECDVTLDTWLRDGLALVPGAVRAVASRELVLACREFFERSFAWRAVIGPENAKAGQTQYWTSPYDEYSNVVGVLAVAWVQDKTADFLTPMTSPPADGMTSSRPTHYFVSEVPDAIELYPELTRDKDEALKFYVALTPKPSVEHLPRIAFIKFYDVIMDGFLARMWSHPNKPYSNPQAAVQRRTQFTAALNRYKGQAKQGYVAGQGWTFPKFGK